MRFCELVLAFAILVTLVTGEAGNEASEINAIRQVLQRTTAKIRRELTLKELMNEGFQHKGFSPLVVNLQLGMVLAGADANTVTDLKRALGLRKHPLDLIIKAYDELIRVLKSGGGSVTLSLSNEVTVDPEFDVREAFNVTMRDIFNGSVVFAAERNTTEVTKPPGIGPIRIDSDFQVQGLWEQPFSDLDVRDLFYARQIPSGREITFMQLTANISYIKEECIEAISLPFKDSKYVMLAMRPSQRMSLRQLKRLVHQGAYNLSNVALNRMEPQLMDLRFPKFKIETDFEIPIYQYPDRFFGAGKKTRHGFPRDRSLEPIFNLFVIVEGTYSRLLRHTLTLDVHETGVNMAGTGIKSEYRNPDANDKPMTLKFDRPFLGYILDLDTRLVLMEFRMVGDEQRRMNVSTAV